MTTRASPRLLRLRRAGDRFVEHAEAVALEDEAHIDRGLTRYLTQKCKVRHAKVELRGSEVSRRVYVMRSDPDTAYLPMYEDETEPGHEHRSEALDSSLAEHVTALLDRLRRYDHEHAVAERDLWSTFVRPTLQLREHSADPPRAIHWEHLQELRHTVILGAPGAGKTSLLRRLASECADSLLDTRAAAVPVYVELRDIPAEGLTGRAFRNMLLEESRQNAEADLERLARSGDLLLLFDGLDEVIDTERPKVAQSIRELAASYPSARVIVSSRTLGYRGDLAGFATVDLLPFSDAQIKEWVWLSDPEPGHWTDFLTQVRENAQVGELVTNPLLLSIAFFMYRSRTVVPRERAALSEYFVRALLGDWDRTRGVQRSALWRNPRSLLAYVCWLAYDLSERGEETFTVDDVVRRRPSYTGLTEPPIALQALAEKSGCIERVGPSRWTFTHAALRDYLAGEYVVSSSVDASELIRGHLGSPRGRSMWLFACGAALDADPLVQLHMQGVGALTCADAALLVEALRQDLEVPQEVVERAAAVIARVLERELSAGCAEVLEIDASAETGRNSDLHLEIILRSDASSSSAILRLVAAIIGARGSVFAQALREHLLDVTRTRTASHAIGQLLDLDEPLAVDLEDRGGARVLRVRVEPPTGLPVPKAIYRRQGSTDVIPAPPED